MPMPTSDDEKARQVPKNWSLKGGQPGFTTTPEKLYTPSGFLLVVVLDKVRVKLIKF
jgi:hypothetical protein